MDARGQKAADAAARLLLVHRRRHGRRWSAASVPLYRLFCAATGYGGTTQRAETAPGDRGRQPRHHRALRRRHVAPGLDWEFQPRAGFGPGPSRRDQDRRLSARSTIRAQPITGTATFNVTPDKAGPISTSCNASASPSSASSPARASICPCLLRRSRHRQGRRTTATSTPSPCATPCSAPRTTARAGRLGFRPNRFHRISAARSER